ncbi:PAS domain S-box-containing protein [Janthinobacterium sp. CG_23.3]|uniref:PAS domain-containing protein n=1 Tax=unclassified Janthinobacterium TaxID=2610881 RepID=UPI0003477CB1|nr:MULTISPECIES: PAS domain-containing protein [unclassified Janthinobacterium]MEC5160547.1 PAS domain S-box-containing protein [Janthinobacterium sp. CG_S6]
MDAKITSEESDTDWLLEEDLPETDNQGDAANAPPPWRVLIVDDDVDVHVVTKFSLSNSSFLGRRLSFLHAYSGAEALTLLRNTPDIAVVLLDVIMESNDAGLQVARRIRDELGNKLVRIVLRTGQPGQALEHSIILDYDINDFWCKTDLTTRKLFTTVISSLRTYASLAKAEQRAGALGAALDKARQLETALDQYALLLTLDPNGNIAAANAALCALLGYQPEQLLGQPLSALCPPGGAGEHCALALQSVAQGQAWAGDLAARAADGAMLPLRALIVPINKDGKDNKARHHLMILSPATPG